MTAVVFLTAAETAARPGSGLVLVSHGREQLFQCRRKDDARNQNAQDRQDNDVHAVSLSFAPSLNKMELRQ